MYDVVKSDAKCMFTVTVEGAEEGADVYVYTNASKGGTAVVTCEGQVKTFEIRAYQTITLGQYTGSPITLQVTFPAAPMGQIKVYAYQLNYNAYENMVAELSDEQLEVTSYDSTHLNGTIDVKEDGIMLLTIPYSEGWSAVVDGSEAEIIAINDALMGIRLDKGSHEINLTYRPHMFNEGLAVSCVCILVIALASVIPVIVSSRKTKAAAPVPEQTLEEEPFDIPETALEESAEEDAQDASEPALPEPEEDPAEGAGDTPQ